MDNQRLHGVAVALIDAARSVVNAWERGDLAGAVNKLEAVAYHACDLIAYTPTDD